MATPDSPGADQAENAAVPGPAPPGHSVDELRAQGKPAEARAEFERLIQEGMESGVDPRRPVAIFDLVRTGIRQRAMIQTSGAAGAQG